MSVTRMTSSSNCTTYTNRTMAKQNFNKEYLEQVNKRLREVMYEEPGPQDWTQFSLSIRDAMLAAATIFGSSTDEQKHNLHRLLSELTIDHALQNLQKWDITYTKREE